MSGSECMKLLQTYNECVKVVVRKYKGMVDYVISKEYVDELVGRFINGELTAEEILDIHRNGTALSIALFGVELGSDVFLEDIKDCNDGCEELLRKYRDRIKGLLRKYKVVLKHSMGRGEYEEFIYELIAKHVRSKLSNELLVTILRNGSMLPIILDAIDLECDELFKELFGEN